MQRGVNHDPSLCLAAHGVFCGPERRHYLGSCWRYGFLDPIPVLRNLNMHFSRVFGFFMHTLKKYNFTIKF